VTVVLVSSSAYRDCSNVGQRCMNTCIVREHLDVHMGKLCHCLYRRLVSRWRGGGSASNQSTEASLAWTPAKDFYDQGFRNTRRMLPISRGDRRGNTQPLAATLSRPSIWATWLHADNSNGAVGSQNRRHQRSTIA